jgi:dUTP pyrophosphatase
MTTPNIRNRRLYSNLFEVDFLQVGNEYRFLYEPQDSVHIGQLVEMFVNREDEEEIWCTFILEDGSTFDFFLDDLSFEQERADEAKEELHLPVKFVKLVEDAQLPVYSTEGSSGMDFFAVEECEIKPSEGVLIRTGLRIELPAGFELQLRSRSSWRKQGLLGADIGTIDNDYRGEVMFTYWNISGEVKVINVGDKIGQGVLAPVFKGTPVLVDDLTDTARGTGAFGSTGK